MLTLPLETQAKLAGLVALLCLIAGAAAWELARGSGRWLGRATVAGGVLQLMGFSQYAVRQYEVVLAAKTHATGVQHVAILGEWVTDYGEHITVYRPAGTAGSASLEMLRAAGRRGSPEQANGRHACGTPGGSAEVAAVPSIDWGGATGATAF